jgi:hypothetical protein
VISDGAVGAGVWPLAGGAGAVIKLNDTPLTIVGVNPRTFTGAQTVQQSPEVFVPLTMQPLVAPRFKTGSLLTDRAQWWVNIMGRARPGVRPRHGAGRLCRRS